MKIYNIEKGKPDSLALGCPTLTENSSVNYVPYTGLDHSNRAFKINFNEAGSRTPPTQRLCANVTAWRLYEQNQHGGKYNAHNY
jgi:hypothetical protein